MGPDYAPIIPPRWARFTRRLPCTKRTVQRDLNVLQLMGFPISFEARDFGKRFWRISAHFLESDKLMLSMTEVLSLFLSQQLLAPLAGTEFGDGLATALEKIKAVLPAKALRHFGGLDSTLLVKNLVRHDYSRRNKEIRILNKAILDGREVRIRYGSASQGRTIDTRFHPYGMVFFGTNLYCIGHMAEYDEVRTLKITRFLGVEMTGRAFDRPAAFSLAAYVHNTFGVFASGKLRTIRIKFTGWAATNVREQQWHHSQKIIRDSDGQLVAEFELGDTTEFKRWLLGYGRHAVVLKPKKLRQEIAMELAEARRGYRL